MADIVHSSTEPAQKRAKPGGECPNCGQGLRYAHCRICGACRRGDPDGLCWDCLYAVGPVGSALTQIGWLLAIPEGERGPWTGKWTRTLSPPAQVAFRRLVSAAQDALATLTDSEDGDIAPFNLEFRPSPTMIRPAPVAEPQPQPQTPPSARFVRLTDQERMEMFKNAR